MHSFAGKINKSAHALFTTKPLFLQCRTDSELPQSNPVFDGGSLSNRLKFQGELLFREKLLLAPGVLALGVCSVSGLSGSLASQTVEMSTLSLSMVAIRHYY